MSDEANGEERRDSPIFASERQQKILEIARRDGRVDVATLGRIFGVTTETVRRDLNQLERVGLLHRVHGGAIPIDRLHVVPPVAQRSFTMAPEKRAIARLALEELPPGGAVLLDSGTTIGQMAELFPDEREMTVVTNALPIAEVLAVKPNLTVLQVGGRVRAKTLAAVDAWATQALAEVSVDVAFVATYGISVHRGLTATDPSEGAVKRAMVATARRVVVLADHSKLGADHLSIFAGLSDVHVLITDDGASDAQLEEFRSAGLDVRVAEVPGRSRNGGDPS
jgi:DeoR family fructose operon transcriptional repressor